MRLVWNVVLLQKVTLVVRFGNTEYIDILVLIISLRAQTQRKGIYKLKDSIAVKQVLAVNEINQLP